MKENPMKLGDLKPARGATKKKKRVGRGPATGSGTTAGKGHKGAKARSGHSYRPWFEGGQMPLQRRLPKRGFTNIHAKPVWTVNVGQLEAVGETTITAEALAKRGFIPNRRALLKILGNGELKTALTVRAEFFSAQARQKIEAAGGTVEVIEVPRKPKRYKKKERTRA